MTETFVAPATTCAFVTITPSDRTMKPVPSPACVCVCGRPPPKSQSNGSTCSCCCCCTSVCTVTTEGETLETADVMAFLRLCETWSEAGGTATPDDCADDCWGAREQPIAQAINNKRAATFPFIDPRRTTRAGTSR